jgi:hypothetical protein
MRIVETRLCRRPGSSGSHLWRAMFTNLIDPGSIPDMAKAGQVACRVARRIADRAAEVLRSPDAAAL